MVCFEHNVMTYAFGDEVLWPTFGDHQCFHRAGKEGLLCSVLVYSITTNVVFKFVQSERQLLSFLFFIFILKAFDIVALYLEFC